MIQMVETEREINFIIHNEQGYVCRLVSKLFGFDLSPLDYCLGNEPPLSVLIKLSDFILGQYA